MYKYSIVIPVYNVEDYIDECILSVINQTYENWEMVLVDDGSTDKSGEICDKYYLEYPNKIKVIHNSNNGLFLTRICGFKEVSGDYICNLDSDDYWANNFLYTIDLVLTKNEVDIVFFDRNQIELNENIIVESNLLFRDSDMDIFIKEFIDNNTNNVVWNKVYSKKLIQNFLLSDFDENIKLNFGEDILFNSFFLLDAKSFLYIPQRLYFYRVNNNSISRTTVSLEKSIDLLFCINLFYDKLITKKQISDKDKTIFLLSKYYMYFKFLIFNAYFVNKKILKHFKNNCLLNYDNLSKKNCSKWLRVLLRLNKFSYKLSAMYILIIKIVLGIKKKK